MKIFLSFPCSQAMLKFLTYSAVVGCLNALLQFVNSVIFGIGDERWEYFFKCIEILNSCCSDDVCHLFSCFRFMHIGVDRDLQLPILLAAQVSSLNFPFLQANTTEELPERLIGAVRVSHIELSSAIVPKLGSDPS